MLNERLEQKLLHYVAITFIWISALTFKGYSQNLNQQSLTKLLDGKIYHALVGEGHYVLKNDTEEPFYEHLIIEFKNNKALVRQTRTGTKGYNNVLITKPTGHDYKLKDSIITISGLNDWNIRISPRTLKLVAASTLYDLRVQLDEIKVK